ncbi:hypothetical protein K437DRAFT_272333 [Tilletiaria anomala UBC 951]|uniref:Mitochondrial distribution and morphology protein 12 n=1 Tax=Tilletiaria anomala (strain ATCC 24038 / CBS 436.72 / UBC 951) TaxID=1037660 RepID=A0A066WF73_TILAU|nr:uncharacterized protein K437DRAFT_272333 [Tilletiaria anomala UBC 951]KDN52632.1 hypothetical protein K437DRAFT_272333 [Tilletiaria anomala UBC 951]
MSLDLDWELFDRALCDQFLDKLNAVLQNANRPDFLGPISVEEFDAGEQAPELEIIGIQDIWSDFLSNDDEELTSHSGAAAAKDMRAPGLGRASADPQRRLKDAMSKKDSKLRAGISPLELHTFRHYTPSTAQEVDANSQASAGSTPGWNGSSSWANRSMTPSIASAGLGSASFFSSWQNHQPSASNSKRPSVASRVPSFSRQPHSSAFPHGTLPLHLHGRPSTAPPTRNASFSSRQPASPNPFGGRPDEEDLAASYTMQRSTEVPSLQIKMHMRWQTTSIRIGFKTAVLINQPCFMFMELPLQVTLTGLVLDGTVLLAFDGSQETVNISLLDSDELNGNTTLPNGAENPSSFSRSAGASPQQANPSVAASKTSGSAAIITASTGRPQVQAGTTDKNFGARLLPFMTFESSVGEEAKHVLRNVGKVEKFIGELVRKVIEDELAFPNYYTVEL